MSSQKVLSRRGDNALTWSNFLLHHIERALANPYTPGGSSGICNLGTAENRLVEDLVHPKLQAHAADIWERSHGYYAASGTTPAFQARLARFLSSQPNVVHRIDAGNIIAINGVTSVLNVLLQILADPGEYVLVVTPFYPAIPFDMDVFGQVRVFDVPLTAELEEGDTQPFQLTVAKIERAYKSALAQGLKVRALLHVNPNNPLGVIYDRNLVSDILKFCARNKLHFISDEIYVRSVFNEDDSFRSSVLSFTDWPDPERTHFVWGFSKDFGLSGLRCAVVYSESVAVCAALNRTSLMVQVPLVIQKQLEILLSDEEWLEKVYFPSNSRMMAENYQLCCSRLNALDIGVISGRGTFFAWADFGKYLPARTRENETALFERLLNAGVYVVPGDQAKCTEPGWFRIAFTISKDELLSGLDRIAATLTTGSLTRPANE